MKQTTLRKMKTTLFVFVMMSSILSGVVAKAQSTAGAITGKVTDENGKPLWGASIYSSNGKNGTSTNKNGDYTLTIDDNSNAIIVSMDKYKSQKLSLTAGQTMNVTLVPDAYSGDDVVDLGYTTQLRKDVSGAVSTLKGKDLDKAPVANFMPIMGGQLSGLTVQETGSEPGNTGTDLYVRGLVSARKNQPLVVIDGILYSYFSASTLDYLTPAEIESITVLKDASTQAIYGIQGANGVIVIRTKRGRKGLIQLDVSLDQAFQQPVTQPIRYDAATYARMRNQAAKNDGLGDNYFFSNQQIQNFESGNNTTLYPNTDWSKIFLKETTPMQRAGFNAIGGSDRVQFFSNLNVMHQASYFNTDQQKYDPSVNNIWINYRTNVDMSINKYLKAFVRLGGNIKRFRVPGAHGLSTDYIYGSIFQLPPTMAGPTTFPIGADSVRQVVTTPNIGSPAYGMLNRSGFIRHTVTNITSQFGLDLDMSFVTKGLSATGIFAYQTSTVNSLRTLQDYERYLRTNTYDTLGFAKKGGETNSPLQYGKLQLYGYHITSLGHLSYKREFGVHDIGAMAYMMYQDLSKYDLGSPYLLPYRRLSSGFEAAYGYDHRYLLKLDVGYSGSEQYARSKRYALTPAISAAWVISEESFLKGSDALNLLKIRGSYGKTGNDQSGLNRYAYLDNITFQGGGPIGSLKYLIRENQIGNPNIEAEISTKKNVGIDVGLFKSFSLSIDVFSDRMENMVISPAATIPQYQGIPLNSYPFINAGTFTNKGYEIEAKYFKKFNVSTSVTLGGMWSYAKNRVVISGEPAKPDQYQYKNWIDGYPQGQQFGYLVDDANGNGYFNSAADITSSGLRYSFGNPRPGDLRFQDLNGDKVIDEKDKAPIGKGLIPNIMYGFNGSFQYKGLELFLLFQGVAQYQTALTGLGIWETAYESTFTGLHSNAWTAERYANKEPITMPALSTRGTTSQQLSDFSVYDRSYLRLKTAELSYSLPDVIVNRLGVKKIRFLISGQNLVTWDKMKSKDFGPEGYAYNSNGYFFFPAFRVFNAGLRLIF